MHLYSKRHQNHYHLTYCSNIHPGDSWRETFVNLKSYIPAIKQKVCGNKTFGIGLRLSNLASIELEEGDNLLEFKNWLRDQNAYVFTMNGFPYGNFHHTSVKEGVHKPDWTCKERVDYTKRLFKQLAYLLPDKAEGGVSTSPLSYKYWHATEDSLSECQRVAAENLVDMAVFLYAIYLQTGQYLHLDIEPEPDGILENSQEVISFFNDYLLPVGIRQFERQFNIDGKTARKIILRHITICYDICHFALAYEKPRVTLKELNSEGIQIGKVQISSALKADFSNKSEMNEEQGEKLAALKGFDEPVYLHQVTGFSGKQFVSYPDISELPEKNAFSELRAHFHVPVFVHDYGLLQSTQADTLEVIKLLAEHCFTHHLEIETYTWAVLPDELKLELSESIIREMTWVIDQFGALSNHLNG